MTLTIDQIRALLDTGAIAPSEDGVIESGTLTSADGLEVPYTIHLGWDLAKANLCDKQWGAFNISLFRYIKNLELSQEERRQLLSEIQVDDDHWRWLKKSFAYHTDEYEWFFLMAEGVPQAACLIYHPKASAIEEGNIFYIEYVAVAPWNRKNPMAERRFKGIGTLIIRNAIRHGRNILKLRYGFSLHAIPRAVPFYKQIGMISIPHLDKGILAYFEMPEERARELSN